MPASNGTAKKPRRKRAYRRRSPLPPERTARRQLCELGEILDRVQRQRAYRRLAEEIRAELAELWPERLRGGDVAQLRARARAVRDQYLPASESELAAAQGNEPVATRHGVTIVCASPERIEFLEHETASYICELSVLNRLIDAYDQHHEKTGSAELVDPASANSFAAVHARNEKRREKDRARREAHAEKRRAAAPTGRPASEIRERAKAQRDAVRAERAR